ncbi:MAG TPA: protoporphyrinogen oxidase [Candidatus Polarisedimenticolia bacterium]|nr:protoporphyrinogen oxidase [Candidatus Polarisedimenticolia bacterium]
MSRAAAVAVVGGGMSGLAAAHRLGELAAARGLTVAVSLYEASARTGGVVSTLRRDGFLLEEGPDSIITDKPWGRALAERLGLAGRLVGTREASRRSFVVRKGRLHPTPDGFYLLAPTRFLPLAATPLFSPLGKARMALDLVLPRRRGGGDESVGSFVRRRLGREALERMAQPMIAGIYGADPDELSLGATFPRFQAMEAEHGSVILGMLAAGRKRADASPAASERSASGPRYGLFVSFDDGLQTLTGALAARLPPGAVRAGARVKELSPDPGGGWIARAAGAGERFDAVILAVPAPEAAALLAPVDPALAAGLRRIPYGAAATVSLAFEARQVSHPMDGAGFVVPSLEGMSITGCTFAHSKYPGRAPEGKVLVRAFWGGASASLDDDGIARATLSELRPLLGIRAEPLFHHLARFPRSMPRYAVGHLTLVDSIEQQAARHRGLALAGNAYRGVGIPDCIHSGESAAEKIIESLGA